MKQLLVGAAALNVTPLDWSGNRSKIIEAIESAKRAGVSVLCLPELAVTGYGCEDAFLSADVSERALQTLRAIAPATKGFT